MNREPTSGPSGSAGWAIWPEVSPPVLALPDASRPDAYYVLPQVPQLARDSAGRPVLSLSLVLSGRPAPEDDSIFGLVQSGSLACDLTLALPESVLSENILPLYARQATFVLLKKPQGDTATLPGAAPKLGAATTPSEAPTSDQATAPLGGGAVPLGEATGSGAGTRVGLGAQLDQAAARGVLLALQGAASDLVLGCRVRYRTADNRRVVHIYGRLANIYDYLRAHIDPTGPAIDRSQLQQLLLDAVRQGALKAWRVEPSGLESSVTDEDGPSLLAALLKVTGAMLMPAPTLDSPGWTPRCRNIRADRPHRTGTPPRHCDEC